jgi:putative hydrolase of HD superfamily
MMTKVFDEEALEGTLTFLKEAGALKDTLRSGLTDGGMRESTAAHSWRLALWVVALEPYLEGYDVAAMLKMAILHDLGEAITGDVPATLQIGDQSARQAAERAAVEHLTRPLDEDLAQSIQAIAAAYDAGQSKEAALMKGLDKLETMIQHITAEDPATFDYAFNLTYGVQWTAKHPILQTLRARIDAMTKERAGHDR